MLTVVVMKSEYVDPVHLIFHFTGILRVNGMVTSIQINNDRYGNCSFRCCNSGDENAEENAIKLNRIQVFVKSHKIDVYAIKHQLDRH